MKTNYMILKLILLITMISWSSSIISEKLVRFGRCISMNFYGKRMKVRLYRENEQTGEIENNETNAWPMRIVNTKYKKIKGYDMNRVYIPNITEIRMKTKMGYDPAIFTNNENVFIYGLMVIKYGYPKNISKQSDFVNKDNSINYDALSGRKFHFILKQNGNRMMIRCTIINPNIANYKGYLFSDRQSSNQIETFDNVTKTDYLTTKETIKKFDISEVQLKYDGLDKIRNINAEIRSRKRRKKLKDKIKEKLEKEKLIKAGYSLEEIKKKRLSSKRKINKDRHKMTSKYQKKIKKQPKEGTVEEFHQTDTADIEPNKNIDTKIHDIRMNEEDEEIRNNQAEKVNEDDVTEEVSFKNDISFYLDPTKKTNRKYSISKSAEKFHYTHEHKKKKKHRKLVIDESLRRHFHII